jgi:protein involved in polysaccharide export with SLBB domain
MRRAVWFVAAWLAITGVSPADAQVPSSDQLELLRSMSPEDREALMERLGIGSEGGDSLPTSDTEREREVQRRPGERDDEEEFGQARVRERTLQANDQVLMEIAFIKDKPARVERVGEGLPPIVVPAELAPVLEPARRVELQRLMDQIRASNPYQLDTNGALLLPGFAPIVLAGLNEEQAKRRLTAIPALSQLEVGVMRLPVKKSGVAGLKPFGYELFERARPTFSPGSNVPVPADYVIGAGDQLNVQLYGNQNRTLRLVVGRDGRVSFPELGPISVAGSTFRSVSANIESRVAREMIGTRASVNLGDARSIQVFVVGDARFPGSYTVSGLSTIVSALYAAGGASPVGSLRDVQLKRQGEVVRKFDLYDLLLRGDTSNDAKLLPGDVIFIPPIGTTVAIDGEVHRPAIYELRGSTSIGQLVALAGGPTNEADTSRVALLRVDEHRSRVVIDMELDDVRGNNELLRKGDSVRVLRLRPTLDRGVQLDGHVFRPGAFAWTEGLRLSQVITSVDELKPNADLNYVMIRRELPPDRRVAIKSADLAAALRSPGGDADPVLMPRDRIFVFDYGASRRLFVDPLLDELRLQSRIDAPSEVVSVDGRIKARGEYPLEPGMRISDLLRAGGGLQDAAFAGTAELTRYRVGIDVRNTEVVEVDLAAILRGDASADLALLPFDFLNVREIPEWSELEQVTIDGEVRFPGTYPLKRGETLRSVLARAGGLTSLAFARGAVFTREELREREQEQLDRLVERLQSDLAATALRGAQASQDAGQALAVGQSLLEQLKRTKAVGRLVIDLDQLVRVAPGSEQDVVLRDGDNLIIPKMRQEVMVIGEVQNSTSHFFRDELSRDDYLGLSGGLTRKADRGRIYIVRADGSVVSNESAGWFRRSSQVAMMPGDTVVVPLDTERMPALPLWQAVTQILYNLAIAAAAVNSF